MHQDRQWYLEETKRHGSVLFPFNIYPCTVPGDFPSVALHWHTDMELIFIKKGRGLVRVGLQPMEAAAEDLFVLPPGTLHGIESVEGRPMEYENIIFAADFLGAGADDLCTRQYLRPLAEGQLLRPLRLRKQDSDYESAAAPLRWAEELCREKSPGYELGVRSAMLQIIMALLQMQHTPPQAESRQTARLKELLERIRMDFAAPLSVEEMAAFCGFSPSHFMRWFRKMTGDCFVSYLNAFRLTEAAQRLRQGTDKVLTVAQECGFESLANFNRQFKSRYGVTPRQYRKGE